jgi:hypothetical protein
MSKLVAEYLQHPLSASANIALLDDGNVGGVLGATLGSKADYTDWTSFTPVIIGTTTAGVGTYTSQVGAYSIVGNVCTFYARVIWTAHTGTGSLTLGTLPLNAGNFVPVSLVLNDLASPASTIVQAAVNAGGTTVIFYSYAVAGGTLASLAMDTGANIFAAGSYRV